MTKRNAVPWWTMSVLALGVVACVCGNLGNITELVENANTSTSDRDTSTDGGEPSDNEAETTGGGGETTGGQGEITEGSRSGDFTAIEPNQSYDLTMHQTSDPYPANSQYFSLDVPDGMSDLEFDLTNMNSDLDIYVQYENPSFSGDIPDNSDSWYSRESDTTDEHVSISSPRAGTYYIEIYPYEGGGTPYTLSTTLR